MHPRQFCKTSVILLFVILTIPYSIHAVGISNGGFESGNDESWNKYNSVLFNIDTNDPYEASSSAKITYEGTSSRGIKQSVLGISGEQNYIISGAIKLDPINPPNNAYIRIGWYSSADASGTQLSTIPAKDNNNNGTVITTNWTMVSFKAQAPSDARSAEIRLYVQHGSAYFDNISFTKEPNQIEGPTPTPTGVTSAPSSVPTLPTISITLPQPTPTVPTNPTPTAQQTSYDNIYISEAMVAPNVGEYEWVELYNGNDFDVTLTDWYIDDIANAGSSPKMITIRLGAKKYGIVELPSGIYNNSGDSVRLLDSKFKLKHKFTYDSSNKGYTWGAIDTTFHSFCIQSPSKKAINSGCVTVSNSSPSPTMKAGKEPSLSPTPHQNKQRKSFGVPSPQSDIYYRIVVTPPVVSAHTSEQIPAVKSTHTLKQTSYAPNKLSFLAGIYSLLSSISLGLKVYLKQG